MWGGRKQDIGTVISMKTWHKIAWPFAIQGESQGGEKKKKDKKFFPSTNV